MLTDELLTHSRACANILTNLLEHRVVTMENSGGPDIVDGWDLYGLSDLLASLLETLTIVQHRACEGAPCP